MKTIKWINGTVASFDTASAWTGGIVPGAGDVAVISSAGDGAPTAASYGLLLPASGSSEAYLSGLSLSQDTEHDVAEGNGRTMVYYTTPQYASVPAGETIKTPVIDLIGAGSEAALYLQNSTLAANTRTNISGDAYVYSGYTNVLAGTVDIGFALKVGGKSQPTPPADHFGLHSALYLSNFVYGSWNNGALSGYVPGTDNTGTINVAGGSGLVVFAGGTAGSTTSTGTTDTYNAPDVAQFENAGTINIKAGGVFETLTYAKGMFVNNGTVNLDGAKGKTTTGVFNTIMTGTGIFNLSGGTQTDPTQTVVEFTNTASGPSFGINDAGVLLDPGSNTNFSGLTYTGGIVTFSGTAGILQIDAPQAISIGQMFNDQFSGFAAGDQINLEYYLKNYATGWQPTLGWNQSQHTLQLYDVTTSPEGQQSALQANFVLAGTYTSSSFQLANVSWNGDSLDPVQLSIVTTAGAQTKAANIPPSAIAQIGMGDLNLAAAKFAHIGSISEGSQETGSADFLSAAKIGFNVEDFGVPAVSSTSQAHGMDLAEYRLSEAPIPHPAEMIFHSHPAC